MAVDHAALRRLESLGRKRGYVTPDELRRELPLDHLSASEID